MLKPYSMTSFYLNDELIDTNYLQWNNRMPNGASNHRRIQAVTKLRLVAEDLTRGYHDVSEDLICKWIKEAK